MFRFPLPVQVLLALSLLQAAGRALLAPVLVMAMSERLGLAPATVGLLIGAAVALAALSGIACGYLIDRWPKDRLLRVSFLAMGAAAFGLGETRSWAGFCLWLTVMECAAALSGIAAKAILAECLPPERRGKVFSLRYTLINVGFALGPLLGAWLAQCSMYGPFLLAGALMLAAAASPLCLRPAARPSERLPGFRQTLRLLASDRQLVLFTLGSLLTTMAIGRFSDYLSLYLLQARSGMEAMRWVSLLITCNAFAVIALQFFAGAWLERGKLLSWISLACLLLAASLAGWALSDNLAVWCGWMLVFTVGEVLLVPAEYLFVDRIAPEAHRGSYYGAQSLSSLGNAVSPVAAGATLALLPGSAMLWMLVLCVLAGVVLMRAAGAKVRTEAAPACLQSS